VRQASEDQPFVARKSKLSQSISLQKSAAVSSAAATASNDGTGDYHNPFASSSSTPVASSSVSYNNAYLEELKASTPMKAPRSRDSEDEPQAMEVDDIRDPAASTTFATPSLSRYAPVLDTTQGIPDEAAIAAAKAKRKTATGTGVSSSSGLGGEDYISINQDNGKLAVYDADARGDVGPHPESRLQREEDEEGDGDAGQYRSAWFGSRLRSSLHPLHQDLPISPRRIPDSPLARTPTRLPLDGCGATWWTQLKNGQSSCRDYLIQHHSNPHETSLFGYEKRK
jgi:hypothetical protein